MKIFFHVGAGKCASSSLQRMLTFSEGSSEEITYGVIGRSGEITTGRANRIKAKNSVFDYATSISFRHVENFDSFENNLRLSLNKISLKYNAIIFSNEGWINEVASIERILPALSEHNFSVILIVRPPVEWLNSAWWQWGAWSKVDLDHWIERNIRNVKWFDAYSRFSSLGENVEVRVLSLTSTIIDDFSNLTGIQFDSECRNYSSNIGSDYRLLRFMRLAKNIRPGPHDSDIEFCLNRHLGKKGSPDWVISRKNVWKILKRTQESNKSIAPFILNEKIISNRRWWGQGYYKNVNQKLCIDGYLGNDALTEMFREADRISKELEERLHTSGMKWDRWKVPHSPKITKLPAKRPELIAAMEAIYLRIFQYDLMIRRLQ